jgi:competence/damage-inducible protein CinA-like protein
MATAEIIAIGSELLTPFRSDTNSLYLTRSLEEHGVRLIAKGIVGDEIEQIVFAFRTAFQRADIIICSGGLGPTIDDLTREGLSTFLSIPLEFHQDILNTIEERFRRFRRKMPDINRKQAMVPKGARVLPNHNGTAPGIFLEHSGKQIFLLPGPPFELEPMWEQYALPLLRKGSPYERKSFRIAMLPESQVDEMLKPVTDRLQDVQYTILAAPSEIEIHLFAPQTASDELISAAAEVRSILGKHLYADELEPLEAIVGRLLKQKNRKVAVAESCTGGFVCQRLTNIPGSSAYFDYGLITYSNEAKTTLLGIAAELIATHGAVSEPVARAMADQTRNLAKSDYGISITGIAGPDGGTQEKPVGTVFIGVSDENQTTVNEFRFIGTRQRIRFASSQGALNLLRLRLLD